MKELERILEAGKVLGIDDAITIILKSDALNDSQKVDLYKQLAAKRENIRRNAND